MTVAWFIDGLDARAGLAFASLRAPDLLEQAPALDLPSVFIGPPTFRPETVSSRALAFAGTRGSFQYGLFLAGQEVAFPSLDAVIEFVRRAYLRGGGGDAAGGGGAGVPPRPTTPLLDPDELPLEGKDRRGHELLQIMLKDPHNARLAATRLNFHPGEPFKTEDFHSSIGSPGMTGDEFVLARGAAELIAEMLRRCPVAGPNDRLMGWLRSAQRLGRSINKLGLWHQLMSDPIGSNLGAMADKIFQALHKSAFLSSPAIDAARRRFGARGLLPLLFCGFGISPFWGIEPATLDDDDLIRIRQSRFWPVLGSLTDMRISDPVDDLAQWPIPAIVAHFVEPRDSAQRLYNLLCAVVASPEVLAEESAGPAPQRAAEIAIILVLFAAAHLTVEATPSLAPVLVGWADDIADKALADVVQTALAWIADQYPNSIFPDEVERLIRSTSSLAYA
jgi:hypothetical protein